MLSSLTTWAQVGKITCMCFRYNHGSDGLVHSCFGVCWTITIFKNLVGYRARKAFVGGWKGLEGYTAHLCLKAQPRYSCTSPWNESLLQESWAAEAWYLTVSLWEVLSSWACFTPGLKRKDWPVKLTQAVIPSPHNAPPFDGEAFFPL